MCGGGENSGSECWNFPGLSWGRIIIITSINKKEITYEEKQKKETENIVQRIRYCALIAGVISCVLIY